MNKKNRAIVVAIIILILIVILLIYINVRITGAAISNNKETYMFKGQFPVTKLEEIDYLLQGYIGDRQFNLHLRIDPREAEKVPSEENRREKTLKNTKTIYATLDPSLSAKGIVALIEITKITGDLEILNIPTSSAVTDNQGREEVLVKTCKDATETEKVIQLQLAEKTSVHSEGNCILVEGINEDELIKASNKLILQLLGVL